MSTVAVANSRWTAEDLAASLVDGDSAITLVPNTSIFAIKNQLRPGATTDLRAIGIFEDGNIAAGASFNDPIDPDAVLSGGIGIDTGVCLSTGFLSDAEPTRPAGFNAVGAEGPNDGMPIDDDPALNPGEISRILQDTSFNDDDWASVHTALTSGSGDPAVLQFQIDLASPGFLRASFVFGSDEYPHWVRQFNDTFVILVKGQSTPPGSPGENLATIVDTGVTRNFSLQDLSTCDKIFLKNQLSPQMLHDFPNSGHKIMDPENYYTFYDHEFAGFSKVLTRETAKPLAPGRYTIKFVIEDVADQKVDSALFIAAGSLKLFSIAQGDYNGNGIVDSADYDVWRSNIGKTNATFHDGDGNGDGVVDTTDYLIWRANFGNTGNPDLAADFNRDGCVDGRDFLTWQLFAGMPHCASRFEGDANGDGKVDSSDLAVWQAQVGMGNCGVARMSAMSTSGQQLSISDIPKSPDMNGDGVVDANDLAELDQIIHGSGSANPAQAATSADSPADDSQPEPTLAEP
jgi:hypothetical protein